MFAEYKGQVEDPPGSGEYHYDAVEVAAADAAAILTMSSVLCHPMSFLYDDDLYDPDRYSFLHYPTLVLLTGMKDKSRSNPSFLPTPFLPHTSQVIKFLLQVAVAAGAWGLLCGWVLEQIVSRIIDPLAEVTLVLSSAYIAYFAAESWLGCSGVLTVVSMGRCTGWGSMIID